LLFKILIDQWIHFEKDLFEVYKVSVFLNFYILKSAES